jgi:YVTN family beta-propeller protein
MESLGNSRIGHTLTRSALLLVAPLLLMSGCGHDSAGPARDSESQSPTSQPSPLPTGRAIDPKATSVAEVGSIPFNMILSPDGKYAITTDQGYQQMLSAIRVSDGRVTSQVPYPSAGSNPHNGLYYGLAMSADGTLYAAQGNADAIAVLHLDAEGNLIAVRTISTRKGDFPSGLSLDDRGRLYVANNDPISAKGRPFEKPGSIAIYEAASGKELGRFEFTDSFGGTPNFPLAVAAVRDGSKLYVASQRDAAVYALDTIDPSAPKLSSTISTGAHPISLLLDRNQSRLFVCNAHSDTVSVVDTKTDKVTQTVLMRPEIARDVAGATPNGMALSPDEKRLYVTLGDMNAVAVVDIGDSEVDGYLPAGWYPTGVVCSPDGKRLLVVNARGIVARHPNPAPGEKKQQSPIVLLQGAVIAIDVPGRKDLKEQTQRVLELDRLTPKHIKAANPLAAIGLRAGKIKHVIYIVKENRTYDQVLGDLPQGNGDPSRCIFGRQVTPNLHAIAERFVLLDNFYDCGEVSGDGWNWSTQAQANEYVSRNVPYSYGGRGRSYDYEGSVNDYPAGGFPAKGPDGKPLSDDPKYKNGAPAIPDVGEAPGGHIWDLARKANLSYRNYGFYFSEGLREGSKVILPANYPRAAGLQPGGHDLDGVSDIDFLRFDLNYADSEAPLQYAQQTGEQDFLRPRKAFGSHDAPSRFSEWNHEFEEYLKRSPDGEGVPSFMTVRFCVDHTMGTNPGHHSPRAMVADNDYACAQLVEAINHSPIWKSTAIFIIEDDAQNGPDHVDAHRSTCYVISPWIKANSVDHTFQNTASVLKTMELLLGLPPMCQYDAVADPILDWDSAPSNDSPYKAIPPDKSILRQINGKTSPHEPISPEQKAMMDESSKMDFARADHAPADRLNEIIWKSVKGNDSVMPPTPHGPPPTVARGVQKDDDD